MYEVGEKRKFEMPKLPNGKSIYYTATIVEKEGNQLRLRTERGEDLTINLSAIVQSKLLGEDRNGDKTYKH